MTASIPFIGDQEIYDALWPPDSDAPLRDVRCRHCGQYNEVSVPQAVQHSEAFDCGACDQPLFLAADAPFTGINTAAYEHDLDRSSLAALKSIPGFPLLVRWLLKQVSERSYRMTFMASHVRCSDEQFPELVDLMLQGQRRLDYRAPISLFLGESPFMNAITTGVDEPLIMVHAALLDLMTDREVAVVLGHEIGHLQADHIVYKSLARLIVMGGMMISGVARLLTWPIQAALLKWDRCSELTVDRAGLLATRDLPAAMNLLMKFAGGMRPGTARRTDIRFAPFVAQARELEAMESASLLDTTLATMLSLGRTHPFNAWRLMHLVDWVERGAYLDILAGDYQRRKE